MQQSDEQEAKQESKQATKKKIKLVPVEVIEARGQSALVEYYKGDIPYRSYVDVSDLQDGECPEERLQDAPYGIIWDFDLDGLAQDVELALKVRGIWTYEDLTEHHRKLIQITTNLLGQRIWDAAKKWHKRRS